MMLNKCLRLAIILFFFAGHVHAENKQENMSQKNSTTQELPPLEPPETQDKWQFKTGFLIETENVEGNSDGKGAWEPTLYLEAAKDRWTLAGSFYQENHNTTGDYRSAGRSDWYDQYEVTARYGLFTSEILEAGILAGARNYHWSYNSGDKKGRSYNTQRYTLQPDWNLQLVPALHFSGWMAFSRFENNAIKNSLTRKEIEGETGFNYALNNTLSVTVNYYIDRGWNKKNLRENEFSQQELRVYLPVTFTLFRAGESRLTPYIRRSLSTWYYNNDRGRNERERDTRFGLLIEQNLPHNLSLTLEYGYELQRHPDTRDNDPSRTRFHYTGAGLSYLF